MRRKSWGRVSLPVVLAWAVTATAVVAWFGISPGFAGRDDALTTQGAGPSRVTPPSRLMPVPGTQPVAAPIPPEESGNLLPELSRLVDREGTITQKPMGAQGSLRTVFRSADERLELVVLENAYLETLENRTDFGKQNVTLRVSGTVYKYRGMNYLLLDRVQIKQP